MSGRIYLETSEYSAGERDGTVTITIRRDGDTSSDVTATYITATASGDGAATDGADFTGVPVPGGTVTIAAGETSVSFTVPILDDGLPEPTERFAVSLVNVDSGELWLPRTANVSILDDENPVQDPETPPLSTPYTVTTTTVADGLTEPMKVVWLPGSQTEVLVAEKSGIVKHIDLATGQSEVVLDIAAKVNDDNDRGLMDVVLHPDLENSPYLYAFYVVDPPEAGGNQGLAGVDGSGNRFAHVVRFDIDLSGGVPLIDPESETVLVGGAGTSLADISGGGALDFTDPNQAGDLRGSDVDENGDYVEDYIKVDSRSHAGGALSFGPDGALYISTGDGTSYDYADPRSASVQSVDSLSGKILRVDALTGEGLADNPFATDDLDANASKVYQLGFRNPFRIAFSNDGELFASDTGWFAWEEVNTGPAGANFGWPWYEGGDGGELLRAPEYERSAEAQAFYAAVEAGDIVVTTPYRAFSHAASDPGFQMGGIVGSEDVYDGGRYPEVFQQDFFFTDVTDGEVYTVDTNDRTQVQYLMDIHEQGSTPFQAAVNFLQGPDGYMYYLNFAKYVPDGSQIKRIEIADPNTAPVLAAAIPDQSAAEGGTFSFAVPAGTFTDADGDALTLAASRPDGGDLPDWLAFDAATATFSGSPGAGDTGSLEIQVTAADGNGGEAFDLFVLAVGSGNEPPAVAVAIPDRSVAEESALSFTVPGGTFADGDGDELTLAASLSDGGDLPDWLDFDAETATFSGTPDDPEVGDLPLRVTATDPSGASVHADFTLTVTPVNDAPYVVVPVAAQEARTGTETVFATAGAFFDRDDASLTYSATLSNGDPLPDNILVDAATGAVSINAAAGEQGTYAIRLTATDAGGATASDVFALAVVEGNDAPRLVLPLAGAEAERGVATAFEVPAGAFADADGDPLTLTASLANGDPLPAWIGFDGTTFTVNAPAGAPDQVAITVTASDGNASAGDSFLLTLSGEAGANAPPELAVPVGAQETDEEAAFSFTLPAATFTDADGDALTLAASLADGGDLPDWLSFDDATATFSGTPDDPEVGTLDIRVTATDPAGEAAFAEFTLTVAPVNDDPIVALPIPDQAASAGTAFAFTLDAGTFADVDDASLTLEATRADGEPLPGWLRFDPATGSFSGTPAAGDAGTLGVMVTATDAAGARTDDVFALAVSANRPPEAANALAAQDGTEEQAFSFTVPAATFTDADGDELVLTAALATGEVLPDWLDFDALAGTFTGTPDDPDVGALDIRVTATDPSGASASADFTLTVAAVNDDPSLETPLGDQAANAGEAFSFSVPAGTFADADDAALTLTATREDGTDLPDWLAFAPATATFSGTPGAGDVGTLSIRVVASDDDGAEISDVFTLVVEDAAAEETLYGETAENQFLVGESDNDVFVLSGPSSGYNWGPTEDGEGVVIWNDAGFDILTGFEELRFTNRSVAVSDVIGDDPVRYDDPEATQFLVGTTDGDRFVIAGPQADFQWGPTQSGEGVVVWRTQNGEGFDILTGFEVIEFEDGEADISGVGTV